MNLFRFRCVIIVGLMSVMLLDGSMTPMTACPDGPQETPVPCILRNPETQDVCYGQGALVNITMKLPQDIMTNLSLPQIKVLVLDQEFSHGSLVAGEHHNGKEDLQRWRIRIIFEGDTMVYEIQNRQVEYRDEFICQLELDLGWQKFQSDFFQWFAVEKCPPPTKSSMPGKEAQQLNATCEEYLLKNMREIEELKTMNSNLQQNLSEVVKYTKKAIQRTVHSDDQMWKILEELGNVNKKMSSQNNQLNTLSKVEISILTLLLVQFLYDTKVVKLLCNKLLGCQLGSRSSDPSPSSSKLTINESDNPDEPFVIIESNQQNLTDGTEPMHISPSDETRDEHTNGQALGHL